MFCYDGLPFGLRAALLVVSLVVSFYLLRQRREFVCRARLALRWLVHRPMLGMLSVVLLSLACNIVLTGLRYPQAIVHDEFAYLLAADTYSQGRLANPPHPKWQHFETYHILSEPTYMAKYPPANGIALALGQSLTGHPIVGSWLAMSLSLGLLVWMLRAWTGTKWALIGGLLLAVNVPLLMAWGQTYWGGSVALTGGALLFGSVRRIVDHERWLGPVWFYSVLIGIGAILLAFSRPFEGLLACLFASPLLFVWIWKAFQSETEPSVRIAKLTQLGLPLILLGTIGLTGIVFNNLAVTGNAWELPYSAHSKQYSATSLFIWQSLPPEKEYRVPRMGVLYKYWSRERQKSAKTWAGYWELVGHKLNLLWRFFPFIGGLCLIPLLVLVRHDGWLLFAALSTGVILLIELQLVHSHTFPHYIAPIACLFYVVLISGLRYWRRLGRTYPLFARIPLVIGVYSLLSLIALGAYNWRGYPEETRAAIETALHAEPGRHLVFVDYPANHNLQREWVYNGADIDQAKIVWANHFTPAKNQELLDYFPDHQAWHWRVGQGWKRYGARNLAAIE